ncbi:glycosyltransferase [Metabacillus indicus]|uniref:glycosyltransferase n=1 Tax=Metabacillus indicus TaxID=246786 RepID=UPI00069036DA|nr:glycosyltransferase [Metabacillus indicus]
MKIGILITSISNFGKKGFYNSQEIGLAKALSTQFEGVDVYKLIPADQEGKTEKIVNCDNAYIHYIPSKQIGINGFFDKNNVASDLGALIHFSDTQFSVPKVYRWCEKNHIIYIPYIGVVESHSISKLKQIITNFMFSRNVKVYKRCICFAKTPEVKRRLLELHIDEVKVAPVGLDIDLLHHQYKKCSTDKLKEKYGFNKNDKIILFVGRLIEEKQPIRMVELYASICTSDSRYKLLMIGSGELKEAVEKKIQELKLEKSVNLVDQIPNQKIWELYSLSDTFANLNQKEIFGMSILEAMYYECKVVAWQAPGPDTIIENGVSGFLVKTNEEFCKRVLQQGSINLKSAHNRVIKHFIWSNMANLVKERVLGS